MKKIIARFMAFAISMTIFLNATVLAAESAFLIYNGEEVRLLNPIINVNGYHLAPMREVFNLLGADIVWYADTKTVEARKDGNQIDITINDHIAYINGQPIEITEKAIIVDEHTYVPLGFIAAAFNHDVSWIEETKAIVISSNPVTWVAPSVDAPIVTTPQGRINVVYRTNYNSDLTVQEAYELAVKNNSDLKTLRANIDDISKARNDLAQQHSTTALELSMYPGYIWDAQVKTTLSALETMKATINNAEYNEEIMKGANRLAVLSSFNSIKSAEQKIGLTEGQIELSSKGLHNSKLLLDAGMMSVIDYDKMVITHEQLLESQIVNMRALETEYTGLNKLIGKDADQRYNVRSVSEYEPLSKNFDLEGFINIKMSADPSIRLASNAIDAAEMDLALFTTGGTKSYDQYETAVSTASLSYDEKKKSMDKNMRDTFNSIQNIETQIKTLELDYEKNVVSETAAKVQYEIGNITQLQLLQAEYAVDSSKISIDQLKQQHGFLVFMLEHPYLLG